MELSKNKALIILITITFFFSSCLNMIARKTGLRENSPKLTEIKSAGHEIIFMGMRHLGKQEFYDNAKNIIIDLKNKGFVIYAESAATIIDNKIILDTTYAKKARKIMGIDVTVPFDSINNSILNALVEKFKLVEQPNYAGLGAENRIIVDVPYERLIDLFETKYGEIILDTCDINTNLGKFYNCNMSPKASREIFNNEYLLEERNRIISEKVKNSPDRKILLIYGLKHLKGIKEFLENGN